MCRLVILLALSAICAAQYKASPETAAIISDSRYLAGDGTFGSAYTQEDGVQFKEESDAEGNRKGSYSYIDPSGQRRTVTYTAGKNGFQAFGDHLPVPPPAPPAPAPVHSQYQPQVQSQYQPQYQPQQYYQPQAHYPVQPVAQPRYQPAPGPQQYDDGQYREEYNDPNYKSQSPSPVPPPSPQYSYSFGPTPAPLAYAAAGVVPQYPGAAAGVVPQYPVPAAQPSAPHRFLPPGKLNLNRTPDGFSYTFNKS